MGPRDRVEQSVVSVPGQLVGPTAFIMKLLDTQKEVPGKKEFKS